MGSRSFPRWPYYVRMPSDLRELPPLRDVVRELRRPYDDCPACGHIFREGDRTVLVPVGPGDNPLQRAQRDAGGPYVSACVLVHVECAPPGVLPPAPPSSRSSSIMRAAAPASSGMLPASRDSMPSLPDPSEPPPSVR